MSTLGTDAEPDTLHRHTVRAYLGALRRIFVVEEQPAWSVRLRSRAPLRKSAKWHLADPSLATAALGANAERLMGDMSALGLLFESLVVRDLRVLARPTTGVSFTCATRRGPKPTPSSKCPTGGGLPLRSSWGAATLSKQQPNRCNACAATSPQTEPNSLLPWWSSPLWASPTPAPTAFRSPPSPPWGLDLAPQHREEGAPAVIANLSGRIARMRESRLGIYRGQ